MIYKLGNISDLIMLPSLDENTYKNIYEFVSVLTYHYGEDRDIDHDDGGYILYVPKGTDINEVNEFFDYTNNTIEYVNKNGSVLCAMYCLDNDYAVVIIVSYDDAPIDFIKEID